MINKITVVLFLLIAVLFCNNYEEKKTLRTYYVEPVEAVCYYPFNDTTKYAITCRVWGLLKYYHPNVTAGKFDWDQVLIERLSKIHDAETAEQVNAELIDTLTVVKTPPNGSLLEIGDIILNLNNEDIKVVRKRIAAQIPSSNTHFTDNAVNGWIFNSIMNGCILTVLRNQQSITLIENRKKFSENRVYPYIHKVSTDIGYVNLAFLQSSDIPDMMERLKDCRGIIFDLRNYPYQFEDWELFSHLCPMQEYCYALATRVEMSYCGAFYTDECITKCPDELWLSRKKYEGKITVLINASTMSWAETKAMRFRMLGATLVGTPTAGANGNGARFSLPGEITVCYSGLGFYYPNGDQMQRKGIIPDIEVYPTMEDIMAGKDEVLEAAIAYFN